MEIRAARGASTDDARFRSRCRTRPEMGVVPREERKVVTCLFCDLVGFTARAEAMDPEDVRRLLRRYHQRVRPELERFGRSVEKFIGDAVMAVFGAPVTREHDASEPSARRSRSGISLPREPSSTYRWGSRPARRSSHWTHGPMPAKAWPLAM